MTPSGLYIGLDAGGTTTRLLARAQPGGAEVRLEGAGANPARLGLEAAARRLADLVQQTLRQARAERPGTHVPIAALCAGVAGAGSEQQALADALRRQLKGDAPEHLCGVHDATIALQAAFGAGSGLILIAGTGSVAYARAEDGALHRTGGWGYLLGDEGSGFALGRLGLQAVAHVLDGGPPTCLQALFAERFDLAAREAILHQVYHAQWPLQDAAPLVLEAADAGDAVAARILREQTGALARQAAWAATQCASVAPRCALFGGLTGSPVYVGVLRRALGRTLPTWPVEVAATPPVAGALRLALRTASP